ncbi:MAG: NUDIX hydrolase [Pseudomonadota bacterium]
MKKVILGLILLHGFGIAHAQLEEGYWSEAKVNGVLKRTVRLRLQPDLSGLSEREREALGLILQVGEIFQGLYEQSRHPKSQQALARLQSIHRRSPSDHSQGLLDLFRIFKGPVGTTLRNQREAFLPVEPPVPGGAVYPWDISQAELDAFLQAFPSKKADILDVRTVVRRSNHGQITWDRKALIDNPTIRWLHPDEYQELDAWIDVDEFDEDFYAVPYSVAYAEEMMQAYSLLDQAGRLLKDEDPDFSSYLRARALGLLTNDYEAGDATWVRGRFKNLNAQIGSFETYDDNLYGVKSFFSLSALSVDHERTKNLGSAMKYLPELEESLPYDSQKTVQTDIPIAVYNVVADFGQSRGTNTATILPNDPDHARKYGRLIMLRANIMLDPTLFQNRLTAYKAAVITSQEEDLTIDGNFERTLWHEVGHYLGPSKTKDDTLIEEALADHSNTVEELKADLVSLYLVPRLLELGYYDEAQAKSVYASGLRRTLQKVKPRPDQPYQTMQLMQQNYMLKHGALNLVNGQLKINYDKYHGSVEGMLREVLEIQSSGDRERAQSFIDQYARWDREFHGNLAQRILEASPYRYTLVTYSALDE